MSPVDPPDLRLWPTLRTSSRSGGPSGAWSCSRSLFALGFTGLSLLIPVLIQRTIDDAIDRATAHRPAARRTRPRSLVAAVLVASGSTTTAATRTAQVGIAVEARLRQMLYEAYLRYPRAFYDRHATGEVISRATNDIYPVRYFIGWGVVQAIQSLMMLVGAAIVLANVNRAPRR